MSAGCGPDPPGLSCSGRYGNEAGIQRARRRTGPIKPAGTGCRCPRSCADLPCDAERSVGPDAPVVSVGHEVNLTRIGATVDEADRRVWRRKRRVGRIKAIQLEPQFTIFTGNKVGWRRPPTEELSGQTRDLGRCFFMVQEARRGVGRCRVAIRMPSWRANSPNLSRVAAGIRSMPRNTSTTYR